MPLETRAVDLAAHAGTIPPELLPYLGSVGRPLAITVTAYYAIKAAIFLLASTVAVCTKDEKRREACLEIIRIVCRGLPWPPRLPGSRA
jgi:hypothetical protein